MMQFVPGLDLPVPVVNGPMSSAGAFIWLLACLLVLILLRHMPPG